MKKKVEYQSPEVRSYDVWHRERIVKASNTVNGDGSDLEDGGIG